MREIKFCVWHADNNEMLGPFDLTQNPIYWADKMRDGVLMQYTGLKDKNGREIYDGDLYTFDDFKVFVNGGHIEEWSGETADVVTFKDGAFYYGDELLSESIENNVLVNYVGNIYENEELLEEK